jgi:hypothetical protein
MADVRKGHHARVRLELDPPRGVGPLNLGMTRPAATYALTYLRGPAAADASDRPGVQLTRPSGLKISLGYRRELVDSIELWRPADSRDSVGYQGIDVFTQPVRTVVKKLGKLAEIQPDDLDPAGYLAPDLLLGFWRPAPSDKYFGSVLVAKPGYYGPCR